MLLLVLLAACTVHGGEQFTCSGTFGDLDGDWDFATSGFDIFLNIFKHSSSNQYFANPNLSLQSYFVHTKCMRKGV